MSDISDSESSFQLYDIDNDAVDIISDELSCSSCESNENEIEETKSNLSEISPYDNNDVLEAKRLGMSVEDMFKMYQEINNYISNEPEYTPEWPFDYGLGYSDEGLEESFYG
jgi:hypothetical protein